MRRRKCCCAFIVLIHESVPVVLRSQVNNGTWWIGHHIRDELTIGLFPCDFVRVASPEAVKAAKDSLLQSQESPGLSMERAVLAQAVPLSAVPDDNNDGNAEEPTALLDTQGSAAELSKHTKHREPDKKRRSPKLRFQQKPVHAVTLHTPVAEEVPLGTLSGSDPPAPGSSIEATDSTGVSPGSDSLAGSAADDGVESNAFAGSPKLKWQPADVGAAQRQGTVPRVKLRWKGQKETTSPMRLSHDLDSSEDAATPQQHSRSSAEGNNSNSRSSPEKNEHREVVVDGVHASDKMVFKLKHGPRRPTQQRSTKNPRQVSSSVKHPRTHMF